MLDCFMIDGRDDDGCYHDGLLRGQGTLSYA